MEHPRIDFDGDGQGDQYDTRYDGREYDFLHHDELGRVDAVAVDLDRDSRIDFMLADEDHDGVLDHLLHDDNGDGIMDSERDLSPQDVPVRHPDIDFNGDGRADPYYTTVSSGGVSGYSHVDGYGHVDAHAMDYDNDGLVDQMYVDVNHDGKLDHVLRDTTGDGYMDTREAL